MIGDGTSESTSVYADWLRKGLERTGKSASGLARRLGYYPSAICRMINGERRIRADELTLIADYLGLPLPHINSAISATKEPSDGCDAEIWPCDAGLGDLIRKA